MEKEPDHDESSESGKVRFKPPKGFVPPEAKDGEFDIVCSFREEEGGELCMTKIGDTELPGYETGSEQKKPTEHKPDYSEVSGPMMAAMGGGQGGAGGGGAMGGGGY